MESVVGNKAINYGDKARFLLPVMQRRIKCALSLIEEAEKIGRIGVSVSSGKDSLVTLDLVRTVIPDAPVAFYDSGEETEYLYNYEFCQRYGIDIITSEIPLAQLCRDYGYWGHKPEVADCNVDFFAFMVGEPAYRFIKKYDLNITAMGLRTQENMCRRRLRQQRGLFYQVHSVPNHDIYYHLIPIADWSHDDVWAYIAGKNLYYNPEYDLMAQASIPRDEWRIGFLLGDAGSSCGRYIRLRRTHPNLFNKLCIDFPEIRRDT